MEPEELFKGAEALIKSYNPTVSTLDSHITDKLGTFSDDDDDKVFMQQVCYGCVRYKKMLKVFLSAFYFNNAATVQRTDYTRYMTLAYITLFRMNDMGHKRFRYLLQSQDAAKVHHFLAFLFDKHNIDTWLKDEWVKVMDRTYLENEILQGVIERNMEWVQNFLAERYERAFGTMGGGASGALGASGAAGGAGEGKAGEGQKSGVTFSASALQGAGDATAGGASSAAGATRRGKPPTQPKAPNITVPRPRVAPEPIRIAQVQVAKPPPNLDITSVEKLAEDGKARREALRKQVADKYQKPENAPFKFHETRSNIDKVREEVERERFKECKFGADFKAQAMPVYPKKGADVKLNVAAVLREDALYKKKQEQDAMLVKAYEEDLRDSTTFYQWQSEMKEKDEAVRKAAVERRRLEMVASQKEAIEASLRAKAENRVVAEHMKLEKDAYRRQHEAEAEAHLDAMKALVEEVKETRETAPKAAAAKVLASRVRAREELSEELAEARRRAEEEARIEQERKDDLIRQIRALERVPKKRVTAFDPTESSGVGLLEELSLVELKERLAMNHARQKEEEAEKRQAILREKREKEAALRKRIDNLSRVRSSAGSANREARARRKAAEKEAEEKLARERAEGNLRLAEKLAEKRRQREAEEDALKAEEDRVAKQRMFLGAAKAAIEERHFEQQVLGAEREAMLRQTGAQREAQGYEKIKATAVKSRKLTKRQEIAAKAAADELRERKLDEARGVAAETDVAEMREKKAKVREEKERHTATLGMRDEFNVYAARTTELTKTQARETIQKRKMMATRKARAGATQRSTLGQTGESVMSGSRPGSGSAASRAQEDEWGAFG